MADVTQYIGARYVPLFADPVEWSDTKQYEPLTVVLHQGNSYTSRQAVPVGVDIDNERFWVETGNYNAQVEQYRQEVISFASKSNVVSPESYGAIGDGHHDDTESFMQMFATGKTCVLTRGKTYALTGLDVDGDVTIFGNGAKLKNLGSGCLIKSNGTIRICDVEIQNLPIYNYTKSEIYGTLTGVNVLANNITIKEVNKAAIYATGNVDVANSKFATTEFELEQVYDPTTADNQINALYCRQTSATKFVRVSNCSFSRLITGIYIGTYVDTNFTVEITNNTFSTMGDHCVYLNSYRNRCTSLISNNIAYNCAVAWCVVGYNHVISNNLTLGVYKGVSRINSGFSIRDGKNVVFEYNSFITGDYVSQYADPSCIITCLIDDESSDIVIRNNVFDYQNQKENAIFLRIGYGNNTLIKNVLLEHNIFTLAPNVKGILSNADTLDVINNTITFGAPFLTLTGKVNFERNTVIGTSNNPLQVACNGRYINNTFDCSVPPLRREGATEYVVFDNISKNSTALYNMISSASPELIQHKCFVQGTFVATGTSYVLRSTELAPFFNNILYVFDSNGSPVQYTITTKTYGSAALLLPSAGTYTYLLIG